MYKNIYKYIEACNRNEKKRDKLVKHTFPGGKYDKTKSIFDKIEDVYESLSKNKNILCIKILNQL